MPLGFERYRRLWEVLFWLGWALVSGILNSLAVIDDHHRRQLPIESWQPVCWEFSSQISMLALLPLCIWYSRTHPFQLHDIKHSLLRYGLFSVVFSLAHVVVMVVLRKATYLLMGDSYDFGSWPHELLYEYRKDLLTFCSILAVLYSYRFILTRLRQEAQEIATGESQQQEKYAQRFIVKKLGKEFIVEAKNIDWIVAAGNYMNLYVGEHCYPLRETMTNLLSRLDPELFIRTHRSYIVNVTQIAHIEPLPGGDCQIQLNGGQSVRLSRRYRTDVFERLGANKISVGNPVE